MEWAGSKTSTGYGTFYAGPGSYVTAHRWAYECYVGPIPRGLHLDHLCRNRACVNPEHLEPVTAQENLLRGATIIAANAAKTHCPAGHPYSGSNLYIPPGQPNNRRCRTCTYERNRTRQLEKKAA